MPRPLPSTHFPKYHSVSPYHSTLLSLRHWQASEIGHKHTHTQLNVSMSLSDFRIALAVLRLKQIWLQSLSQPGFGPKAGMHKSWMPGRTAFVHPWRRVSIPCRTQTWRGYILVAMVSGTGDLDLSWHTRRCLCFKHATNDALKGPNLGGGGRLIQTCRLNSGMWPYGSSFLSPWYRYPFSLTNKPSLSPTFLNGNKQKKIKTRDLIVLGFVIHHVEKTEHVRYFKIILY